MSRQQELQRKKKEGYFKLQIEEEMGKLGLSARKQKIVSEMLLLAYRKGVTSGDTNIEKRNLQ